MTTIGITGIGGFIGKQMAIRASRKGWNVRGFDIDPQRSRQVAELGVKSTVGDVGDPSFLTEFFDGVDIAFHTAAIVDESGDERLFRQVNVEGTRNVVDAAQQAGVERLVHLSSVMVYGFDYPDDVEESWAPGPLDNIYCATKLESDLLVRQAHEQGALETIVIRPGDVYGAGSRPWVLRPLEMMEAGLFNLPGRGRGVVNHVHVDNLLDAVFLALERGATGGVFNITDGRATECRDFFAHHAGWLGKEGVKTLPTFALKSFLTIAGPAYRLFGTEPPATVEAMDFLLREARISTERAHRELGYEPRIDLEEGMDSVADQLRQIGRIE